MTEIKTALNRIFVGTIVLYLIVASIAILGFLANNSRVNDIQHSRRISCERTYEGIREVFKPFFIPANKETPKQKADQAKFNRTIDSLKRRCDHQVNSH